MKLNTRVFWKTVATLAAAVTVLCTFASMVAFCKGEDNSASIPTTTILKAIQTANEVQKGSVLEVTALHENGRSVVDVDILAEDGRRYDVVVDASNGKVLSTVEDKELTKMNGKYVTKPLSGW